MTADHPSAADANHRSPDAARRRGLADDLLPAPGDRRRPRRLVGVQRGGVEPRAHRRHRGARAVSSSAAIPRAFARLSGPTCARSSRIGAGGLVSQAIARDRERVHRPRGQGGGRPGLRAVRRSGPRPRPRVLVALRLVPRDAGRRCSARRRSTASTSWEALGREVRERGYTAAKTNPVLYGAGRARAGEPRLRARPRARAAAGGRRHRRVARAARGAARGRGSRRRPHAGPELLRARRGPRAVRPRARRPRAGLAGGRPPRARRRSPTRARASRRRSRPARRSTACWATGPTCRRAPPTSSIVDVPWNGLWESLRIAALADAFEVNVAPHNFYGHLATHTSLHFAAAAPNVRILELEVDDVPWHDDLVDHAAGRARRLRGDPRRPGWGLRRGRGGAWRRRPPR